MDEKISSVPYSNKKHYFFRIHVILVFDICFEYKNELLVRYIGTKLNKYVCSGYKNPQVCTWNTGVIYLRILTVTLFGVRNKYFCSYESTVVQKFAIKIIVLLLLLL